MEAYAAIERLLRARTSADGPPPEGEVAVPLGRPRRGDDRPGEHLGAPARPPRHRPAAARRVRPVARRHRRAAGRVDGRDHRDAPRLGRARRPHRRARGDRDRPHRRRGRAGAGLARRQRGGARRLPGGRRARSARAPTRPAAGPWSPGSTPPSAAWRWGCGTCPRRSAARSRRSLLPFIADHGGVGAALLALAGACLAGALAAALGLRRPEPARPARHLDEPPPSPGPLRDPAIWRLSLGTARVVLAQLSLLSFLALYLHEERGWLTGAAAARPRRRADRRRGRARGRRGVVGPLGQPHPAAARAGAGRRAHARAGRRPARARPDGPAAAALIVAGVLTMAGNGVSFAAAAEMAGAARVGTALGLQNTILVRGRRRRAAGLRRRGGPHLVAGRLRARGALPAGSAGGCCGRSSRRRTPGSADPARASARGGPVAEAEVRAWRGG